MIDTWTWVDKAGAEINVSNKAKCTNVDNHVLSKLKFVV